MDNQNEEQVINKQTFGEKNKFSFKLGLKQLNLESFFLPHLQKYIGGAGATSKGGIATTSRGSIKVLQI
jgi:hypothetical protein